MDTDRPDRTRPAHGCGGAMTAPDEPCVCGTEFPHDCQPPKNARRFTRVLRLSFSGRPFAPRWQAGSAKPALYFGRCPVCRCSRVHREPGWVEVSLLGWTAGVAR